MIPIMCELNNGKLIIGEVNTALPEADALHYIHNPMSVLVYLPHPDSEDFVMAYRVIPHQPGLSGLRTLAVDPVAFAGLTLLEPADPILQEYLIAKTLYTQQKNERETLQ